MRTEIVDAMLEEVSAEMGMFLGCATAANGQRFYTNSVLRGSDRSLIETIEPLARGPVIDSPWLPPNTDPATINTFVRVKSFYPAHVLMSYEVHTKVFDPLEVGDHLRAIFFDGPRFLGYLALLRRGAHARFRADEQERFVAAVELFKAGLAAADALEARSFEGDLIGVSNAQGVIEHATEGLVRWLNPDRRTYLARRIRAIDAGTYPCGTELFSGGEVRVTRLDGGGGVRYLITVEQAQGLWLGPEVWLTERQLEVAEYAGAGATNAEIARAMGISPETVKTHMKSIYERLGVSTRQELAVALAGLSGAHR
jgi:DNA-binding CsgD family transcriptional regulator